MKFFLWLAAVVVFFVVLYYVFKLVFITSLIISLAILIIPTVYLMVKARK